jgi:hypothetical protein
MRAKHPDVFSLFEDKKDDAGNDSFEVDESDVQENEYDAADAVVTTIVKPLSLDEESSPSPPPRSRAPAEPGVVVNRPPAKAVRPAKFKKGRSNVRSGRSGGRSKQSSASSGGKGGKRGKGGKGGNAGKRGSSR